MRAILRQAEGIETLTPGLRDARKREWFVWHGYAEWGRHHPKPRTLSHNRLPPNYYVWAMSHRGPTLV